MAKSKKGKQRAQPQNVEDEPLDTITEAAHEEGGQWQTEETDPDAWNQPVPGGWGETRHPVSPALSATRPPGAWDHTQPPAPWPGASPTPPPPPLPPPAGGDPWNLPPPVPPSTINKPPSRRSSSHRHTSRSTRAPGGKGSHFASWQTWAAEAAGAPAKPAEASVTAPYAGGWGESAPQASVRPTGGGGGGWESWAREDHSKREQGWAAPTQEVNTGGGWNTQDSGGWDTQNSSGWDNQANGDWDDYNEANDSGWPAGGGGDDTYGGWEGGGEGGGHGQGGDDSWGAPTAAKDGWQSWAKQADHAKPGVPATPRTRNISTSSRPSSRTMAFATNRVSATSTIPWQSSTSSSSKGMDIYNAGGFALSDGEVVESLQRPLFNHERLAKDRLLWLFPRAKDKRVSFILQWIISMEYGLAALALDAFLGGNERGALIVNAATFSTHNPMFDWITHEDAVATRDKRLQESIGFYEPVKHAIVFVFLPSASGNSAAVWRQKVEVPESAQAENRRAVHSSPRSAWKKQVYVDEILPSMKVPKKKKGFFRRIFRIFKIFKVDW